MSATITRLPGADTPAQSHLARELQYLKARNERRTRRELNEPPRDRYRWRRIAWAHGLDTCPMCNGTGEIDAPSLYGEYEGKEDCPLCQRATFDDAVDPNQPAF